jgi:hypothetical protein
MRGISAFIIVFSLAASFAGVQAFAVTSMEHPAGCHGSMPVIPSHAPTSYQCCAYGHHWAVAGSIFSPQPPVALCEVIKCADDLALRDSLQPSRLFVIPSSSPPSSLPLRI